MGKKKDNICPQCGYNNHVYAKICINCENKLIKPYPFDNKKKGQD